MGRAIPMDEITTIQPTLSISLTMIWILALVATISGLCGLWPKKVSNSSRKDDNEAKEIDKLTTTDPPKPQTTQTDDSGKPDASEEDQFATRPLPPPPSSIKPEVGEGGLKPKIDKTSSLQNYMSKTTSRRKLTSSISMKVPTKIKDKASEFKGKASEFKSEIKDKASDLTDIRKNNENESLWTKRIILGEKCRLPNHDDGVTSYDDQSINVMTRSLTQARKAPSLSRSCSSIDHRFGIREEKVDEKVKGKEKVKDDDDDGI